MGTEERHSILGQPIQKSIPAEIPNKNTSIHQINLFSFGAKKNMLF